MNTRLPQNSNEKRYFQPSYRGLPVIGCRGPLVEGYLEKIHQTIESSLSQYPRVFATRFDLMFPADIQNWPSKVISRFLDYFKSIVVSHLRSQGLKPEKCQPRVVWAKERNCAMNSHYHVLLLLNRDVFHTSGRLGSENLNLISRIESSWAKALGLSFEQVQGLVHFPANRDYKLDRNSPDFYVQLADLFYRASYLAKEESKAYEDGSRHFSCSQGNRSANGFDMAQHAKRSLDAMTQARDERGLMAGGLNK